MLIPNFLIDRFVDKEGNLSPSWSRIMNQLINELQINLNNEGYVLPQQPSANIAALTSPRSIGAVLYNNTTNQMMVNLDGVWTNLAPSIESSFTPTLTDALGNEPTYVLQEGQYSRIANRVFVSINLEISAKAGITGTDPIRVANLPYTVGSFNQVGSLLPGSASFTFPASATSAVPQAINGQEYLTMSWIKTTGAVDDVIWNDFSATGSLNINLSYKV